MPSCADRDGAREKALAVEEDLLVRLVAEHVPPRVKPLLKHDVVCVGRGCYCAQSELGERELGEEYVREKSTYCRLVRGGVHIRTLAKFNRTEVLLVHSGGTNTTDEESPLLEETHLSMPPSAASSCAAQADHGP